jgi:hypothetical protein
MRASRSSYRAWNPHSKPNPRIQRQVERWEGQRLALRERVEAGERPTLYLGNVVGEFQRHERLGSKARVWGCMHGHFQPRHRRELLGDVLDLVPTQEAIKDLNLYGRDTFLRRYTRTLDRSQRRKGLSLAPGDLSGGGRARGVPAELRTHPRPVLDGDAVVCRCPSRRPNMTERPPCHLEESAWWLLLAGWDVVLYDLRVSMMSFGGDPLPAYANTGLPYTGPMLNQREWNPDGSQLFGSMVHA